MVAFMLRSTHCQFFHQSFPCDSVLTLQRTPKPNNKLFCFGGNPLLQRFGIKPLASGLSGEAERGAAEMVTDDAAGAADTASAYAMFMHAMRRASFPLRPRSGFPEPL
jgi:hypothetical protein